MTEILDAKRKVSDDQVTDYREASAEIPSLSTGGSVVNQETDQNMLSRSQAYWLSIGEKLGECLVRKKSKP